MKCYKCGAIDSYSTTVYIDRNMELFTESELEAFRILNPEFKHINFDSVVVCGMCYFELKHKNKAY